MIIFLKCNYYYSNFNVFFSFIKNIYIKKKMKKENEKKKKKVKWNKQNK